MVRKEGGPGRSEGICAAGKCFSAKADSLEAYRLGMSRHVQRRPRCISLSPGGLPAIPTRPALERRGKAYPRIPPATPPCARGLADNADGF